MRITYIILIFNFLLTLTSCSTEINIGDYINTHSALTLSINKIDQNTSLTNSQKIEIKPDSEKFKRLIDWGVNNQSNWTKTPASYISDVSVTQNDFRLLYNHDFVVVGFTNKDGEPLQYSKKVKSGELDFLTEIEWKTYEEMLKEAGFILTFKYPENIVVADVIDNCRCVGSKIKNYDVNQGTDSTNTRQWSICMQDTSDYSVDYLIDSWKLMFKGEIEENRDSISVDNAKALRVVLKDKNKDAPYRKLIYLKKYSTLFEIINIYENTNNDFEKFYNSLKINKIIKPSP